jgi:7-carboxy-7-deazaguanine synthase
VFCSTGIGGVSTLSAMETVQVCEIFTSLQGESTYAGLSCFFIRLAGCNLRCTYCDTPQARAAGETMRVDALVGRARDAGTALIEITGGEPLLQAGFPALAAALVAAAPGPVLVETNGTCDLRRIPEAAVAVMDIKTPGSGEADAFDAANVDRLRPHDEVKCVVCDRADYAWAAERVRALDLTRRCRAVHFSPARGRLDARVLADWILADGPAGVRLQLPLHTLLGIR